MIKVVRIAPARAELCSTSPDRMLLDERSRKNLLAALTTRRLWRGVFHSIVDLRAAIHRHISEVNAELRPFVRTADPDRVLAAINPGELAVQTAA